MPGVGAAGPGARLLLLPVRLVAFFVVSSACGSAESATSDAAAGDIASLPRCPTAQPQHVVQGLRADGRPLTLPTQQTKEPCDGVDNDDDGFTDPHCGTVPCESDADCTYGGAVPDADCNAFQHLVPGFDGPGCNQIDGYPSTDQSQLNACWGVLCPAGQKCVGGECGPAGAQPPCGTCESGRDCPLNAGCIPLITDPNDFESRGEPACVFYCHETPCPAGFACSTTRADILGKVTWHRLCFPEGQIGCPQTKGVVPPGVTMSMDVCQ